MVAYPTGKNQDGKNLRVTLKPYENRVGQDMMKRNFRVAMFTVFKYYAGCHIREGLIYLE